MDTPLARFIPAAIAILLLTVAGASRAEEMVPARWEAHQVKFHYAGFTSHYTCGGIKLAVRRLLLAVGARDDLKIQVSCGGPDSEVQPSNRLTLGFSVPVAAGDDAAPGETFPAEWRKVKVRRGEPKFVEWGDCELVEQFRDQVIVPIFHPQDLADSTVCTPKQVNIGSPNLSMTLLMPVKDTPSVAAE